jgi:hypothetical protein
VLRRMEYLRKFGAILLVSADLKLNIDFVIS